MTDDEHNYPIARPLAAILSWGSCEPSIKNKKADMAEHPERRSASSAYFTTGLPVDTEVPFIKSSV